MRKAEANARSLKEDSGRMQHNSPILCRDSGDACGDLRLMSPAVSTLKFDRAATFLDSNVF